MRIRFGGEGLFRPEEADANGLVVVGGALTTALLIEAYSSGVFPWSSDPVVSWWSPDPRAVFELERWKAHRSVQKRARQAGWSYSVDRAFADVMKACAAQSPSGDRPETWISPDFMAAYQRLFALGHAHSVEVWEGKELVGGLYGVQLGAFFGGESMFHRRTDASKAAVGHLIERCRACHIDLVDAQVPTDHLAHLGAVTISRVEYLRRLKCALRDPLAAPRNESGTVPRPAPHQLVRALSD